MSRRLFFQGDNDCVLNAGAGYPPVVFEGRILWVADDDQEFANRVLAGGYEEVLESDQRYELALRAGNLLRCTLKSAGLA